ncbi:MAG: VanZ family protein [Bacteroidetes bacterium]|nr:VanZ family protein [Bacteroidota bacterium]MBT3748474.1 VanZ family protein [Bacteroidota bacterium]MBT4398413.1 VanZ family protein [Bacteroidota bacterium]MBT4411835.1 VanZ family protein [Bacteroidota bacterium]MBT7091973.1 VanZ family protein [Bacteroidota bacterium]
MLRKLLLISIIWAAIILVLCALPGDNLPKSKISIIPHFDKLVHMGLYFPLSFLFIAVFDLSRLSVLRSLGPILTLGLVGIYGGFIELAQENLFVHRSAELLDFIFDLIGGLLGILTYYILFRKLFHRISMQKKVV